MYIFMVQELLVSVYHVATPFLFSSQLAIIIFSCKHAQETIERIDICKLKIPPQTPIAVNFQRKLVLYNHDNHDM